MKEPQDNQEETQESNVMEIPIQAAYLEACQALGEEIVKGRFISKELERAQMQLGALVSLPADGTSLAPPDKEISDVQGDEHGLNGSNGKTPKEVTT